jgi:hypothetical protein
VAKNSTTVKCGSADEAAPVVYGIDEGAKERGKK